MNDSNNTSSNKRRYFLSFADSRMAKSLQRIACQAKKMNVFDEIYVWDETNLDEDFKNKWKHVLSQDVRGFGYWVWKPYSILKVLKSMPEGSTLLYCDAGSHLNSHGKKRLQRYYNALAEDELGIKAFPVNLLDDSLCLEKRWTKGDVFDHFACRDCEYVSDTAQYEAGTLFIRKCDASVNFIKEWYKIFEDNFSLIDDSESKSANFPDFERGLHDQSVFSVLFKLRGGVGFDKEDTLPYVFSNPIWTLRDKNCDIPLRRRINKFLRFNKRYLIFKIRKLLKR